MRKHTRVHLLELEAVQLHESCRMARQNQPIQLEQDSILVKTSSFNRASVWTAALIRDAAMTNL
jgi:hypothetical protein